MLGRPGIWAPDCMKVTPGPWLLLSVCMAFKKQSLSATFAVWGRISESQAPDWPCWANFIGEPTSGIELWLPDIPVSRCPPRTLSGSCSPVRSTSVGFQS